MTQLTIFFCMLALLVIRITFIMMSLLILVVV